MEKDIRFIKAGPVRPFGRPLAESPGFWIASLFPPLLALGGGLAAFRSRRRRSNSFYFRSKEAFGRFRAALRRARRLVKTGELPAFYAGLQSALLNYLADKSGLSPSGLVWDDADRYLVDKNISEELRQELRKNWDLVDLARYGLPTGEDAEPLDVAKKVEETIRKVNKSL
jgi:hypothetical protein